MSGSGASFLENGGKVRERHGAMIVNRHVSNSASPAVRAAFYNM